MSADGRRDDEYEGFRMLCETCGVGFWHIDASGHSVYLNPAMCEMLEVPSAEALRGITYHRFFPQESLARMRVEHEKRPSGVPSTYEVDLIGKRGTRRTVAISGAPLTDAAGQLTGLIGTFTDVTALKQAEREREASETRLRSLFAASVDAIAVSSAGLLTMVNRACTRLFNYEDDSQMVGRAATAFVVPAERERVAAFVAKGLQHPDAVFHYRTQGLKRTGEAFPMEVHVSEYREGGRVHRMAIMRDLTEPLQLEEQLRQAQKMEALGRLSGGIAHDFNNLLMVVLGCAELVLETPEDARHVRTNTQLIRSAGERAVALTRQLLTLSRKQILEPQIIDLNEAARETAEMMRRVLGPEIQLHVEVSGPPRPIRGVSSQIQQVLMNLCLNARDAISSSGRLEICADSILGGAANDAPSMPGLAPGSFARLRVRDTGQGMDEQTRQRAFEPFFSTKPQGTGLGLATVYGIVRQSGGHIAVESAPGAGTLVTVCFPLAQGSIQEAPRKPRLSPPTRTGTVLIVDDELSVREVVQRFVESLGHRVLTAADAREALKLYAHCRGDIDVIVTDVLMPGMSGVELAKELDRTAAHLPIIFMSGYAQDEGMEALTSRPHSAFLTKPFTLAEVAEHLQALLSEREAGGASQAPPSP